MNMKDAFRFQNKLQTLMGTAQDILSSSRNITKVENTYLRKKVMPEAEDEVTVDQPTSEYSEQITCVAEFLLYLMTEKEKLGAAIYQAKATLDLQAGLDGEIGLNSTRQELAGLFRRMTEGEFANGEKVLRAKIDMASPNINMRDPVIYRIAHVPHHQTGDKWCVYPMYDFAHPLSDAAEKVTYSLCSLEFENHRPLYNWFVDAIGFEEPPRQIEFARLNLNYCVTSKRKCLEMVQTGVVNGGDDPRMVTLCGMRRRGYPAAAIRDFIGRVGVAKAYSVVDYGLLEACVRDNLNQNAPRAMAVLNPLKLVIDNYPEGKTEEIEVEINPDKPELGRRKVTFSRELYVEREDFMAEPVKKYFRLFPGNEVRLKSAYYVTCNSYDTDENGEVTCLHCTYDPESRGGETPDGRKVRGTLHWVSAADNVKAQVRLYDRLFNTENPAGEDGNGDYLQNINPDSLKIIDGCLLEGGLRDAKPGDTFQFMRQGYFCVDKDSTPGNLIINRTVALNSSWDKKKK